MQEWDSLLGDLHKEWGLSPAEVELLLDPEVGSLVRKVLSNLRMEAMEDLLREETMEKIFRKQGEANGYHKARLTISELIQTVADYAEGGEL